MQALLNISREKRMSALQGWLMSDSVVPFYRLAF
jgi:hypothetical protein